MACKKCTKSRDINLNPKNRYFNPKTPINPILIKSNVGRFFYFILLLVLCLPPFINIIMIYFFWKAIYGLNENNKENQESNKIKNEENVKNHSNINNP